MLLSFRCQLVISGWPGHVGECLLVCITIYIGPGWTHTDPSGYRDMPGN